MKTQSLIKYLTFGAILSTAAPLGCYSQNSRENNMTSDQRQEMILKTFRSLDNGPTPISGPIYIDNWRDGLRAIGSDPKEIGYYLRTAELLEEKNDPESAMHVLEFGFYHFDGAPLDVCQMLQGYYEGRSDRPSIANGCLKIIEIC